MEEDGDYFQQRKDHGIPATVAPSHSLSASVILIIPGTQDFTSSDLSLPPLALALSCPLLLVPLL